MDTSLSKFLLDEGMNRCTIEFLQSEEVTDFKAFVCLREEHFVRMLKKKMLSIGQHTLLWEAWRKKTGFILVNDILT